MPSRIRILAAVGAAVVLLPIGVGTAQARKCDWTVRGTLRVAYERLPEMAALTGGTGALADVLVKVSARSKVAGIWGSWKTWETTRTDSRGRFTVAKRKGCGDRQLKIEVKFQDGGLEIRHRTATSSVTKVKWYEVVQDADGGRVRTSSTIDLGALTFRAGAPAQLGDFEARHHAELWSLYRLVFAHLAAKGPGFAFKNTVKIKYPHDSRVVPNAREASYVNPTTKVIYIHRSRDGRTDQFTTATLLHELGHRWAFERSRGEVCLTLDLIMTGDTHDLADDPCVAFHEGFAKYFQQQLERELFGEAPDLPYNRARLNSGVGWQRIRLTNLDLMGRLDEGWWSVLTTLSLARLYTYDFGTAGGRVGNGRITPTAVTGRSCVGPSVTFTEVLRVFEPDARAGFPEYLDRADTTIDGFLTRADAVLTRMDADERSMFLALADPAGTMQPEDFLCRGTLPAGRLSQGLWGGAGGVLRRD